MAISTQYGNNPNMFGHKDYYKALEAGKTHTQIKRFLDANPGLLFSGNKKGSGGLYDEISKQIPTKPNLETPNSTAISDLQTRLTASDKEIARLSGVMTSQSQAYGKSLDALRGSIGTYATTISGYQTQVDNLNKKLSDQAAKASQFKKMDTQYVTGNQSGGVRLRRSKAARDGLNILGAAGLNRKNRSQMKIKSLNP